MAMKFENKKLNKDDHAKVDKEAGVARKVVAGIVLTLGAVIMIVTGKKASER